PPPSSPLFPYTTLFRSYPTPKVDRPSASAGPQRPADSLVPWSNTGYLEARVLRQATGKVGLVVTAVNCLDHVKGLKKTKGGIGRDRKSTRLNSSHDQIS